jgi:hypothetical protein
MLLATHFLGRLAKLTPVYIDEPDRLLPVTFLG